MREMPNALGLLHVFWIGVTGGGAAWATTTGAVPPPAALVAGDGESVGITAAACRSSGAARAGKGAGPEPEVFCKKIAPKIATQMTIASADAIAARRMSDLCDAASLSDATVTAPAPPEHRVSDHIFNPS